MKYCIIFILSLLSFNLHAQYAAVGLSAVSPLSAYSKEWNDIRYSRCNTAAAMPYLSQDEKELIYILNLLRTDPVLFNNTVVKKYPQVSGKTHLLNDEYYYRSLLKTLSTMKPVSLLEPDRTLFESAQCHAQSSGRVGYAGHKRVNSTCEKLKSYYGECCDYGNKEPLDIIMSLLIDEGVPSLGHRTLFLRNYTKLGVSIQPHVKWGTNAVFDFSY
jgi:hypothetical protein